MAAALMAAPASFDWEPFLAEPCRGKTAVECGANHTLFAQGQAGDSVFFLRRGRVTLAVTSHDGKEAIVDTISAGGFFGEECLGGQPLRVKTAVSGSPCALTRVDKATMGRMIHEMPGFAELLVARLLARLMRSQDDLVDQLFNSSEKRLARTLLMLSRFGKDSTTETVASGITQEHLAQMVGTTRSRVNYFLNKFRTRGLIDYHGTAGITVHRGLLGVMQAEEEHGWDTPSRSASNATTATGVRPLRQPSFTSVGRASAAALRSRATVSVMRPGQRSAARSMAGRRPI